MTFKELINFQDSAVISADHNGIISMINKSFSDKFGWTEPELIGKPLTIIIPSALRDAHQLGLSAYLSTGKASLLGQRLDLEIINSDGSVESAEHYILSGEIDGQKAFAAQITPRTKG